MPSVRSRSILISPGSLTLVVMAIAIVIAMFAGWTRRPRQASAAGITVVRGSAASPARAVPLTPVAPARVASTASPVETVVADIRGAYPVLSDVAMVCEAGRCSLTGTIRPLATQADLDQRQEMLLGGLAAALATNGYRMAIPFQFDEVADNTFQIRANVAPDTRP